MSGAEKTALLDFVRSGGGFLGVHSATDTFYTWPDYLDLIGGYFNGHPWHQAVTIEVVDPSDPLVTFLGNLLQFEDEIYQISDFDYCGSHVLLRLDQSSVDLSKPGAHQRSMVGLSPGHDLTARGEYCTALGHEASVRTSAGHDPCGSSTKGATGATGVRVSKPHKLPRAEAIRLPSRTRG